MPDETPVDPNAPPVDPNAPLVDPNAGFDPCPIIEGLTNLVAQFEGEVDHLKKFIAQLITEKNALVEQIKSIGANLAPRVQAAIDLVRSHLPGR